ncbi:glycosyltransferase [Lachnospiraceae bacterium MD308]|nr:glycosyltransferase [Lachnospiraceae bacterium MD308]
MADISVIIPIYNGEKYLERCMDSILSQSGVEVEVICIDDGSTDRTADILDKYEKRYFNVTAIRNENNKGVGYSRNKGMELASGRYIQFVDADDYLLPGSLSRLYQYAGGNNAQMCFFKFENDSRQQSARKGIEKKYSGVYEGRVLAEQFLFNREFFYYAWCAVVERDFLKRNNIKFSRLKIGEGGDFIIHALMCAKKVLIMDGVCYHYSYNPESVTNADTAKNKILLGQIYQYIEILKRLARDGNMKGWKFFLDYQYTKIKAGINTLSYEECEEIKQYFEDDFSGHLVKTLISDMSYDIRLSSEQADMINRAKRILLYGAGYLTYDVLQVISRMQADIMGIAVTKLENNPKSLFGHHVYEIAELQEYSEETLVIVAANKKYNPVIEQTLERHGFRDYIFLNADI